jgi:hypothetical protein
MVRVFRDSYRENSRAKTWALIPFWLHTIDDLISSALKEHTESENSFMNNLRKDLIAGLGTLIVIAVAFALLGYGRKNEVSSILFFGYFLDALATAGIVGNLVIFLLAKVTRLNPFRTALYTFVIVHAILVVVPVLLVGSNNPALNKGSIFIGYLGSLVFWVGLHWVWSRTMSSSAVSVSN